MSALYPSSVFTSAWMKVWETVAVRDNSFLLPNVALLVGENTKQKFAVAVGNVGLNKIKYKSIFLERSELSKIDFCFH